ncbi:alpha/beta hydrolase, partial [Limosilactobacillus reuteri]
ISIHTRKCIPEIHGKNAQHSKLHNNSQVNRELIKFLWEESN